MVGGGCDSEGLFIVSEGYIDIFDGLLVVVVVMVLLLVVLVICWVRTMIVKRIETSYYFVEEFNIKISTRQKDMNVES